MHGLPDSEYDSAQWLLLSAVIVSIGLGALILLLNAAILTGHSSVQSITSFPKDELRNLHTISVNEAAIIGQDINSGPGSKQVKMDQFNESYKRFVNETNRLYVRKGALINLTCYPEFDDMTTSISNASINITYYDGTTYYNDRVSVPILG